MRSRVGVNSSTIGTATTATPATPAPTTNLKIAMNHQPSSGASAITPVPSEKIINPAINGRRRPKRSPSLSPHDAAGDRAEPGAQQHHRRLAEREAPLVVQDRDDERDQEEVEQVEHRADHHRGRQDQVAPRERRLVERAKHRHLVHGVDL